MLVTGELWPSKRVLEEEKNKEVPGQTQMENVEHLGQYVYEMTNAKVQQLRVEKGLSETPLVTPPFEVSGDTLVTVGEEDYVEIQDGFEAEEEE
jgi:intron-binding protein aquarius